MTDIIDVKLSAPSGTKKMIRFAEKMIRNPIDWTPVDLKGHDFYIFGKDYEEHEFKIYTYRHCPLTLVHSHFYRKDYRHVDMPFSKWFVEVNTYVLNSENEIIKVIR